MRYSIGDKVMLTKRPHNVQAEQAGWHIQGAIGVVITIFPKQGKGSIYEVTVNNLSWYHYEKTLLPISTLASFDPETYEID